MNNTNKGKFVKGQKAWNKGKRRITFKKDFVDLVIKEYQSGLNVNSIANKYNYSSYDIRNILIDNNIPRRSHNESRIGHTTSQETKEKISRANKGHTVSKETREAVSKANKKRTKEQLKIQLNKSYITKKKNKSFNKSKDEEILYETLLKENVNKTIYRQYKDEERYPFYCDFYIVEDDLFIELNAHWTHGDKPFDKNDSECIQKLNEWKQKAKTSKFYQQAIHVWTELDVKKAKCAKEHNLNYKVIY